jgi:hypothetical protein
MLPFLRALLFLALTILAMFNLYLLDTVGESKFVTPDGIVHLESYDIAYVIADYIVLIIRLFALIVIGSRLIQVPHDTDLDHENEYLWHVHEGFFLLIISTFSSTDLMFDLFTGNAFRIIHEDFENTDVTNNQIHDVVRYSFTILKSLAGLIGGSIFVINFFGGYIYNIKNKQGKYKEKLKDEKMEEISPNSKLNLTSFVLEITIYVIGIAISIIHGIFLLPGTGPDTKHSDYMETRKEEFIIELFHEVMLGIFCCALVTLSYFKRGLASKKTKIASSFMFRSIFLGLYTSALSTWNLYSLNASERNNTLSSGEIMGPIIYYFVTLLVTSVLNVLDKRKKTIPHAKEVFQDIYEHWSHKKIVVLFWRIGILFGLSSLIMTAFLVNTHWFSVEVHAGTLPANLKNFATTIEKDIEDAGHALFQGLKDLDPCRWGFNNNEGDHKVIDKIQYSYSSGGHTKNRDFSYGDFITERDTGKSTCDCHDTHPCDCDFINDVHANVTRAISDKERHIQDSSLSDLDSFHSFSDITNDDYKDSLRQCHSTECDIVLGIAIASEVAILSSNLFSWIPFLGEAGTAVDTGAWFGQIANRVGHGVIKVGYKLASAITNLASKLKKLSPLFSMIRKLANFGSKAYFSAEVDSYVIYVPILINGFFCFLVGFWKRNNVQNSFKDISNLLHFFGPLALANIMIAVLLFVYPFVVGKLFNELPPFLLTATYTVEKPLKMLRYAYIMSAMGTILFMFSAALDSLYLLRNKFVSARRGIATPIRKLLRTIKDNTRYRLRKFLGIKSAYKPGELEDQGIELTALVENGGWFENYFDLNWLNAFMISAPVFIIVWIVYANDIEFISFAYGPSKMFLKVLSSFQTHTDVHHHHEGLFHEIDNGICGLIGHAIEGAIGSIINGIKDVAKDIFEKLEHFFEVIFHFEEIVNTFENAGKVLIEIFDDVWRQTEKLIVLIIPIICTFLMLFAAFIKSYGNRNGEYKEDVQNAMDIIYSGILVFTYYNLLFIILMQQIFKCVHSVDIKIVYFELVPGKLMFYGMLASLLNLMSMFSLYVSEMYSLR